MSRRCLLLCVLLSASTGLVQAQEPAEAPAPDGEAVPAEEPDPRALARELEDVEFRVSLPTEEDTELWKQSGFRFQFGYAFGWLDGAGELPSAMAHEIVVRAGARLEPEWSLFGTLSYGFTDGEICGVRFIATIEPTFHPVPELAIALGWGLGGFVETASTRPDPAPEQEESLVAPYTMTEGVIPVCTGLGTAAVLRVDYQFVLGNLFSMGPSLEGAVMWTGCEEDTGRVEPDTAEAIVRRQWWQHYTISAGWMFSWR